MKLAIWVLGVGLWAGGLSLGADIPSESESQRLTLEVGLSESLTIPGLWRVAVSDGKVVRARQVSPSVLLLSARKVGRALVRAWDRQGKGWVYRIDVREPAKDDPSQLPGLGVVHISLQFVELSSAAREQLGVHLPSQLRFHAESGWQVLSGPLGMHLSAGASLAEGWLHQLVRSGGAKILAEPQLQVRMGEQASFLSGGEMPIPSVTEGFGRIAQNIEWKPYGLSMKVRPESADHFVIRSDVQIEISEVNAAQGVQGVPGITKRHLVTRMNSRDGETVLLSGLVRRAESRAKQGLPGISQIPIFGAIFTERADQEDRSEVLIAMTLSLQTRAQQSRQKELIQSKWGEPLP